MTTLTTYDRDAQAAVLLELSRLPERWAVVARRPDGVLTDLIAQLGSERGARGIAAGRTGTAVVWVGPDGLVEV